MTSNHPLPTFQQALNRRLRKYRTTLPLALSIFIAIGLAISAFGLRASIDSRLADVLSEHAASLVEIGDGPELSRLASSVSARSGSTVSIVNENTVVASSNGAASLGRPYLDQASSIQLGEAAIGSKFLSTRKVVSRPANPLNAFIVIDTPIKPIIFLVIGIFALSLVLCLVASKIFVFAFVREANSALTPIQDIDAAIAQMSCSFEEHKVRPFEILELENIRRTILRTSLELADAKERMAETRAHELAAQSYQRLLHDLYAPIAALGEVTKNYASCDDRKRAERLQVRSLKLAEQILNQISVAKENLGMMPTILADADIRSCIRDALEQSLLSRVGSKPVSVETEIPEFEVMLPHDPAQLRRAVTNLVSNALEACREKVHVKLSQERGQIVIKISDDGSGVRTEDVSLLLQGRFKHPNRERVGLGLPSANHVTRLNGGRLVYKTSELGGAAFEMRF